MPANIVDARLDNFETVLKEAEAGQGPGLLLILFVGDVVASTGESWCPDCVRAEPVIYDQVNGADRPVTMVRVFVGDKPTWKTREHPLRTDKRFRITGIPTLIRWENGAQASRLEASEAADETKIKRLMRTRSSRSSSMSSGGSRSASSSPRASKSKSSSFTSKRTS
ncbi:hypothetical protein M758_1G165000 [Ceratodon purpureus]|uniref:Thioredoxin domain-containing protein n=1 Tax=Ceratodon purpureus TaxID=3225 RepID=A0A8T0J8P8_CERPU|nr:hypothetical protein KC19_1G168900 [Ceratodon purpureus]KAG0630249.1 hypothetical protein M758_1G165000 [Ceratodon purpureus]